MSPPLRARRPVPPHEEPFARACGAHPGPSTPEHLVVQAQDREPEKLHRVVAAQRALGIDVDAKVFLQRPNSPDSHAIRVTHLDSIKSGAAEPPATAIELERATGVDF